MLDELFFRSSRPVFRSYDGLPTDCALVWAIVLEFGIFFKIKFSIILKA